MRFSRALFHLFFPNEGGFYGLDFQVKHIGSSFGRRGRLRGRI